jgi:phage baseplate assembly protein W
MTQNVPPTRKRNCLWPLRKSSNGWLTGTLGERYHSAIQHLARTPRGSIPWSPAYGSLFYKYRTQQINAGDKAFLQDDFGSSLSSWVPDISLVEIDFVNMEEEGGDDESLEIRMAWCIPDSTDVGTRGITVPRFAFGPVKQTITI